jgi:hypothetical protein
MTSFLTYGAQYAIVPLSSPKLVKFVIVRNRLNPKSQTKKNLINFRQIATFHCPILIHQQIQTFYIPMH